MKENQDYKNDALAALKGNWASSVLAMLAYSGVALAVYGLYLAKYYSFLLNTPTDLQAAAILSRYELLSFAGSILIIGPLDIGLVNSFNVLLSSGDNRVASNEFRIGFGNWLHHIWGNLLKGIFIALWSCLLIVPGIIKSLSYAMTNYILVDHPELSANQAINLSKEMMAGHKYDLFYLYLGFAGWFFLSIFTLGLGVLWFYPYVQCAQASFYHDVKAEWEARRAASTNPDAEPAESPSIGELTRKAEKSENPEDYMPE